jgi:hypothetical protein
MIYIHDVNIIGVGIVPLYKKDERYLYINNKNKEINITNKNINKIKDIFGIRCSKCNELIYSKNRHDFVTCSCGTFSVDGGRDYFKLTYEELIPYVTEVIPELPPL